MKPCHVKHKGMQPHQPAQPNWRILQPGASSSQRKLCLLDTSCSCSARPAIHSATQRRKQTSPAASKHPQPSCCSTTATKAQLGHKREWPTNLGLLVCCICCSPLGPLPSGCTARPSPGAAARRGRKGARAGGQLRASRLYWEAHVGAVERGRVGGGDRAGPGGLSGCVGHAPLAGLAANASRCRCACCLLCVRLCMRRRRLQLEPAALEVPHGQLACRRGRDCSVGTCIRAAA